MSERGTAVVDHAAGAGERTLFGHPLGLYVLFFTEMWERFSFYSMRAFMVLYMTKVMLVSEKISNEIYGAYLGFVYAAPFVGGMLADRLLGQRKAIVSGGILMAVAQFSLAAHALLMPENAAGEEATREAGLFVGVDILFFIGLGLLSAGNGLFKPNISTIVGSLYPQNDARRDGAFTIFYMGINVGALLAGFSGMAAEKVGWHWGFIIAGCGMLVGQVIFSLNTRWLQGKGLPPRPAAMREPWHFGLPRLPALVLAIAIFIPGAAFMMANPAYVQNLALFVAVPVLVYLIYETVRGTREEAGRMTVIIILCTFSMMFWAFFELAGSALNLFADQKVDRVVPIFGELTASFLTASINPWFIIILSIPFAWFWAWLNRKNAEPSSPLKFALGLTQLGLGYLIMYVGAMQAGKTGQCNIAFLVFGFLLHTTGELCLSPVGLSTITKLSPTRLVGTFMGVWFLASALGNVFGGMIGGMTEDYGFDAVFWGIGIACIVAGVLLFILTPILKRMMHGVK